MTRESPFAGLGGALSSDDFAPLASAVAERGRRGAVGLGALAEAASLHRPNPPRPACASGDARLDGREDNGAQRWSCRACGRRHNSLTGTALEAAQADFATTTEATDQTTLLAEFADPSMRNRPLTRWWVPGSQMDEAEVEHEIEDMVAAGFGGAEIVPVSTAGGDGEGELDWGSDEWKAITKHILEVVAEHDFTIDFTMTPA